MLGYEQDQVLLHTVADPIGLDYHRCVPVTATSGKLAARKPGSSSGSATTENQKGTRNPCEDHHGSRSPIQG